MKKKILVTLLVVLTFICLLAVSVSADSVHAGVNKTQKVTLTDGTELALFDEAGNALIWYIDGTGYSSIRADASTIDYNCSWSGGTHGKTAYQLGTVTIKDANGNAIATNQVVVFNIMDDEALTTSGKAIAQPINAISGTFSGCTNLQYAYLRLDTVNLFDAAFNGCSNLKYVNLESLTGLVGIDGATVFNGCSVLFDNQTLDLSNTAIVQLGVNSNSKGGTFCGVAFKKIILPNTLQIIGHYAFQNCTKLETFHFPSSVTTLGGSATFKGCTGLVTVTGFENTSVKTIPYTMFFNCTSLESISLPSTATKIEGSSYSGDDAFKNCTSLTSITIPKSITQIYGNAFTASGLVTITFEDRKLEDGTYNPLTFYGWAPFESCKSLTKVVLPEGLTNLVNGMFNACSNLTSVTFPTTLNSISGSSQFQGTKLTEVIGLENTKLPYIAHSMFRNVSTWTGDENGVVRLPNTVQYIDSYGLADVKMTTLYLGSSYVGKNPGNTHYFAGCKNLTTIYAPATTQHLTKGDSVFKHIIITSSDETVIETLKATTGITNVVDIASFDPASTPQCIVTGANPCETFLIPHELGKNFVFVDVYTKMAIHDGCANCDKVTVTEYAPIFFSLGYSHSEEATGKYAIMQGFAVKTESLEIYNEYNPNAQISEFGLLAGSKANLDLVDGEIFDANGEVAETTKVAYRAFSDENYVVFEMKISGLEKTKEVEGETIVYADLELFNCAYYLVKNVDAEDNVTYTSMYMDANGITETLTNAVTYNGLANKAVTE